MLTAEKPKFVIKSEEEKEHKAVVLYSGGFDSTSLLFYLLLSEGYKPENILALNINYGQRNIAETFIAKYICKQLNIPYKQVNIDNLISELSPKSDSALLNKNIKVDTDVKLFEQPNTYVPYRNLLFISLALFYAESNGYNIVYSAIQRHHKYYYWDATVMFADILYQIGRISPVKLDFPFIHFTKKKILQIIKSLYEEKIEKNENIINPLEILELTLSCYDPKIKKENNKIIITPCNKCGSCQERNEILPQREIIIEQE